LEDPDNAYKGKTIQFNDGAVYKVKRVSTSGAENFYANAAGYPPLRIYGGQVPEGAMLIYHYDVDTTLTDSQSRELSNRILEEICNYPVWEKTAQELKEEDVSFDVRTQKEMRDSFLSEFGALLFLGCLLSLVFLVATVLIIYYKQIAEGYEDVKRFDIMKKVGMTEREIKKSINSQLLMVFFIPLVTAGLHLSFAFPLIEKIIMLMGICNRVLLAGTSAIGFAVFAGFYMIVYKMTANEYYRIVNGKV